MATGSPAMSVTTTTVTVQSGSRSAGRTTSATCINTQAAAVLVIESGETGGALITADLANSYERDVLAVPGRAGDIRSAGCNAMIKGNSAAMIESADDIIYFLKWDLEDPAGSRSVFPSASPTEEEAEILELLRHNPGMDPGNLSAETGIPVHTLLALLLQMELKHWISVEPGNRYHTGLYSPR